jgi:hypothetical protein
VNCHQIQINNVLVVEFGLELELELGLGFDSGFD